MVNVTLSTSPCLVLWFRKSIQGSLVLFIRPYSSIPSLSSSLVVSSNS